MHAFVYLALGSMSRRLFERSALAAVVLTSSLLASCGKKMPTIPEEIVGSCRFYINGFARADQCTDYHGEWAPDQAQPSAGGGRHR